MFLELLFALLLATASAPKSDLDGAWQTVRDDGTVGTWIVSDGHFAIAWYRREPAKFVSTEGGSISAEPKLTYEFDTAKPDRVGTSHTPAVKMSGDRLIVDGVTWTRIDSGAPGALKGAWLMTGRKRDGEITTRKPGARRTMKILSGTRFQWIAYNVETKQFSGSGGGTYTTADGKYTETIEFFSRDDTRSGKSLEFQYDFVDGAWHHVGRSTAGEPMHEVWSRRAEVGI